MSHENETRTEFTERIKKYPDLQDITFVRKEAEFGDVHTLVFKPEHKVHFMPGYYVHLVLWPLPDEIGKPVIYLSISSKPSNPELRFTTHLRESDFKNVLSNLEEGDKLSIYKIKGDFVLPDDTTKSVVLLAGGIGITPFRSMLLDEFEKDSPRDLTLIHVSDTKYCYEDELSKLPYAQNRINREQIDDALAKHVKEKPKAKYYVSGPPGFVDALKEKLENLGIPEENIKQDWFDGYDNND